MIESGALVAIGGGVGAAITTAVYLGMRLFRRNGNSKGVTAESVRTELHERVNKEVAFVRATFVQKEVCGIVSEGLQRDITAIKTGVDKLLENKGD